jgi:hypothetical protein
MRLHINIIYVLNNKMNVPRKFKMISNLEWRAIRMFLAPTYQCNDLNHFTIPNLAY